MKDIKIKHLLFEFASLGILMLLIPCLILLDVNMKTHWVGEISLTEFSQEIFLLIAIVIFYVAAFSQSQARGLFILIAGLFSMMFIREGDHFLDYIYKGFWRVPVIMVLLATLYFSYKNKNSILKPMQIHIQTRPFTYIFIGFMVVVVFSRVFATGSLWQIIMKDNYMVYYKDVIQEGLETLGYSLILFGSIMFYLQQKKTVACSSEQLD